MLAPARCQPWRQLPWLVFISLSVPSAYGQEDLCANVVCPAGSACNIVPAGTGDNGSATVCIFDTTYTLGNSCAETQCPRSEAEGMKCTMWPPQVPYSQRRPACKYCHTERSERTLTSCITKQVCVYDFPQSSIPPCTLGGSSVSSSSTSEVQESVDDASIDIGLMVGISVGAMLVCVCLICLFVWSVRSSLGDDEDRLGAAKRRDVANPRVTIEHWRADRACESDSLAKYVHEHHNDQHRLPHDRPSTHSNSSAHSCTSQRSSWSSQTSPKAAKRARDKMIREVSEQGTLAALALDKVEGYKQGNSCFSRAVVGVGTVEQQHCRDAQHIPTQSAAAARAMDAAARSEKRPSPRSEGSEKRPSLRSEGSEKRPSLREEAVAAVAEAAEAASLAAAASAKAVAAVAAARALREQGQEQQDHRNAALGDENV